MRWFGALLSGLQGNRLRRDPSALPEGITPLALDLLKIQAGLNGRPVVNYLI